MNIKQAAAESGLSTDTIRFYERRGVLPPAPRRPNGYREYTVDHVATLRLASGLRDLGFGLAELGVILAVAHDATCGELREALTGTLGESLAEIDRRVIELTATRARLAAMLEGLRDMRPQDSRVPGATPCGCVELVSSGGARVAP